jgi:hypothetical protein
VQAHDCTGLLSRFALSLAHGDTNGINQLRGDTTCFRLRYFPMVQP